jgi:TetR/AcrR family transcriptional regulator, regulator of cefoperazone and chloramphenicol sensitivity
MSVQSIKRRHPEDGGYARGEETRARIITTALRVFGEEGYIKASTRQIAAKAGVNPPALQYYFGSKEGLHRACGQFIADQVMAVMSPVLTHALDFNQRAPREEAIEALCAVLDATADSLVAAGSERWCRFVTRGKADGAGPAIGMLRQSVGKPIMLAVAHLVAVVTHEDPADEIVRIKAASILGQITTFLTNREGTMEVLNWPHFDAHRLQIIKTVVREHTRAILAERANAPTLSRARRATPR